MRTPTAFPVTLAANQEKTIPVPGRFMHVRSCSVASFQAGFGDDPLQSFFPGATYPSAEVFDKVRVKDSLGAGCTLMLIISEEPLRDVAYDEVILANINTAIAAVEAAVADVEIAVIAVDTSVDLNKAAVDLVGTAVDLNTVAVAGVEAAVAAVEAELQGDTTHQGFDEVAVGLEAVPVVALNAARKGCSVQSHPTNGGLVYLGFDDTVGPTKYAAVLSGGDAYSWDNYRGVIYAESDTADQKVGYGEW